MSPRNPKIPGMRSVAEERVEDCNEAPVRPDGKFVLYWMIANRRLGWNFSLQRAVEWSNHLDKPLLILEALRCDYPWACERFHRFILEGMLDNAIRLEDTPARFYPYVELKPNAGKGLLAALAKDACVIVTDHFPAFFLPNMVASAAQRTPVRMEQVDSNGLLPMAVGKRAFPTAYSFRRFLHRKLPKWLSDLPDANPLKQLPKMVFPKLPRKITSKWPPAELSAGRILKKVLPVDSSISPAPIQGGTPRRHYSGGGDREAISR
jgi:deoxyribodipyrimidine photo-lyase